jgi:hypothetical protein
MFSDPPEQFVGIYDVVHVRLAILVVETNEALFQSLKNLAKLLKPGGYLQWDELDVTNTVIFPENDKTVKVDSIKRMDAMMRASPGSKWIPMLPEMMTSSGFDSATYYQIPPRIELMKFHTDTTLLVFVELANSTEDSEKKKAYWEVVESVHEECRNGASHATSKIIFVARKKF